MKIVLADDERLIRLGLKSMLEELYPEMHAYLEVTDGKQLVELVKQDQPDLIFLDIHMPKLNGLEAYEQFARMEIPVIMLTGYSEFEYARKALKLGASEYLLKPASIQEVKEAVEKASEKIGNRRKYLLNHYNMEFNKVMDLYESIRFVSQSDILVPPFTLLLFYFDISSKSMFKEKLDALIGELEDMMEKQELLYAVTFLNTGELCLICGQTVDRTEIQRILKEQWDEGISAVTGFVSEESSLESLFEKIGKIQELAPVRICTNFGRLFEEEDMKNTLPVLEFSQKLEQISVACQKNDRVSLLRALDDLAEEETVLQTMRSSMRSSVEAYFKMNLAVDIKLGSLDELRSSLLEAKKEHPGQNMIAQIQIYVEKNYMNQIGINTISELLNISPNYLSRIYKNSTGENFVDYLTSVRMKKAKELFEERPGITVKAVSEAVGYFSTRYFTKVFMKYTGMLPSEFVKNKNHL